MPITPEQARAELARRELERRGVNLEQPTQEQPEQSIQQSPLDQTISQRPDIYNQAVQEVQNLPQNLMQGARMGMPGLPLVNLGIKSLGGLAQRAEAAIANPFILKQGMPQNPLTAIKQGITGQQLGELGDVVRQTPGVGNIPGVPEIAGLVGTGMIGGALSKWAGLTSKANNLVKLETTYGKDVAKNMIRWSTGMPEPAIEQGMSKGWKKVLTKENLDPTVPTRIAKNVLDNLDEITQKEYDKFGIVLDRVKTGNVKAIDLNQAIENTLKSNGYLDEAYQPTLKSRGSVVNKIQDFIDTAQRNRINPNDNISVDVIQTFKKILKNFVPEKNWIGKVRSLKGEQRLAKDLSNSLDDLIAYNSYGIEDQAYTQAKREYSLFKNFEKAIMDTFSEVVGQEVKPTADKIVNVFDLHPTKSAEEISKLKNIGEFLKNNGYKDFSGKLLDWLTTQSAVVKPQQGGASLYPFRLLAESTKYGTRQLLKSGIPAAIGGNAGNIANSVNPYTIPPSVLRMVTGRNYQEK